MADDPIVSGFHVECEYMYIKKVHPGECNSDEASYEEVDRYETRVFPLYECVAQRFGSDGTADVRDADIMRLYADDLTARYASRYCCGQWEELVNIKLIKE